MYVDDDWANPVTYPIGTDVGGGRIIGTDAFGTIQAAITAATAGDTVDIAEGDYSGALSIPKSLSLVGAGSGLVNLDISGAATANAVNIAASNVTLSGMTIQGSTSNTTVKYGVYAAGRANLTFSDLVVDSVSRTGVNLNGATDFTITGVTSTNNGGAGFFFTDVKRATLTDVATDGNAWTGLAFSTSGRYYPIGVEDVTVAGASTFGEAAAANGGIMFEESRWTGSAYDPSDPYPITFSTDAADGADVTLSMATPLPYALSGPQDDDWSVRNRLYATLDQGLAAAAGTPDHYLPAGRTLSTYGALGAPRVYTVAPLATMSIQAAIDAASAGDTVNVMAGTYFENVTLDKVLALRGNAAIHAASGAALTITAAGAVGSPTIVQGFNLISNAGAAVQLDGAAAQVLLDGLVLRDSSVGLQILDGSFSGLELRSSVVVQNGNGILVGSGATGVMLRMNRIVANGTTAVTNTSGTPVDAAYNWWGSNSGPGGAVAGLVTSAPYVVLTLYGPGQMVVNGSSTVTADLRHDSTGADISGLGTIPGLPPVGLTASLGTLGSTSLALVGGTGTTSYAAGVTPGTALLTASLDGATAASVVNILGPPLFVSGPASAVRGSQYTLNLTSQDGPVLGWVVDWGDGNVESIPGDATSAVHVYRAAPGGYTISATAQMATGTYAARNTVAVALGNDTPTVAIAGLPAAVAQGQSVLGRAVATDAAGDPLTYAWVATRDGQVVAAGEGDTFAFSTFVVGDYVLTVTVADPYGGTAQASQALAVTDALPSVTILPVPAQVDAASPLALVAQGSDPNPSAVLTYAWTVRRNGLVVAVGDQPTLSFTPGLPGAYEATVLVSDGEGGTATQSIAFAAVVSNDIPAPVERTVEALVTRTDAVVQQQEARLTALQERYGENPPPVIQRLMQRIVLSTIRIQRQTARRIFMIQRIFGRGPRG